ncbi:methyltransferase family protein [Brachybacterium hainanense]|uniref:Methyltransferase family protein n=1 Tax=Brachybacterium hainanense TaxID=1541174 RepID=A0ABV6RCM3_9MICO
MTAAQPARTGRSSTRLSPSRRARWRALSRGFFALQALLGAIWWILVATSPVVRAATLGGLPAAPLAVLDVPLFVVTSALAAAAIREAVPVLTAWTCMIALFMAGYATVTTTAGLGAVLMIASAVGTVLAGAQLLLGSVPVRRVLIGPLAFRRSPRRDRRELLASTFAQIIVFWTLFLVVIPVPVVLLENRWRLDVSLPDGSSGLGRTVFSGADEAQLVWSLAAWAVAGAGVLLLIAASALGVWSAYTMASIGRGTPLPSAMPRALVIAGPYRYVRNPMAMAGIGQGMAVGLIAGSWMVVAYALAGAVLWHLLVRPPEEADLAERFGDPYLQYRAQVRCWIPRRRPVPVRRGLPTGSFRVGPA